MPPIHHPNEPLSNTLRDAIDGTEPRSLRTYTPSQTVIAGSAGIFHWTPEGRRLFDFTSGVLVSNLGHNPTQWMARFNGYMGWSEFDSYNFSSFRTASEIFRASADAVPSGYFFGTPFTAYNAITPIEGKASRRLVDSLRKAPGGSRMERVMWAASGSEAIQKALWAGQARDRTRSMILATRFGFHGKKGLANAVTGTELDPERDPRVHFVSFPMAECRDVSTRDAPFDATPYRAELAAALQKHGRKIGTLITEPYLGGGGSFHPPRAYLQLLERFCREHDVVFILDEVQANFGRCGSLFAFERYGLEPDIVVLGKGLGNGVPVAAAVGRTDLFDALDYGEGSDTWSANPLNCAAVLATLDEFESRDVLGEMQATSRIVEGGLIALKEFPFVSHIRGELEGMVWGIEMRDHAGRSAAEWANAFVLAGYLGMREGGDGVHLLGPLSKKVVRIAPPLVISRPEAEEAMEILATVARRMIDTPAPSPQAAG